MVYLPFVRKIRRRKIVAICTGISAVVIGALILVSFLGDTVGSFTVALTNQEVKLALDTSRGFEESTSFLRVSEIYDLDCFTESGLPTSTVLDTETSDYNTGAKRNRAGNIVALNYFKYTFYVKNVGTLYASYDFELIIAENIIGEKATHGLDDILRVRLYSNADDGSENPSHTYRTFAKRSELGEQEKISNTNNNLAAMFESNEIIVSETITDFAPGDIRRYTIVYWLEGSDEQCVNNPPENCSMKLGVEITGYENE